MLASLQAQPTRPLEVIVVDQSSSPYALEPFPELVHLYEPQLGGLTAARNHGVSRVKGDVVLFFDDDVVLQSDCVAAIAELFAQRPDVVGAQCSIHNPWDDEPFSLHDASRLVFEHGFFDARPKRDRWGTTPRLIDGLASSYRRSLFDHERFDESLPGYGLAEDWDFTKRASRHGKLAVAEKARVEHKHSSANRPDVAAYMRMRRTNILYLYEKLRADRDIRNRIWKAWWILGESLRALKYSRKARPLP